MKTNIELLECYLQEVRFWLPKAERQDIIAELSEDIRSQLEEEEARLGRKLNENEMEALLKRYGSPFIVAHRYMPPQYLIGPVLYPIYRWLMKWFALIWVFPMFLIWLGYVIFSPEYRAHSPVHELAGLWLSILYMGFNTTLAFAIVERIVSHKPWASRDRVLR